MKDQLKQVVLRLRVFNVNSIRQMAPEPDGSREAVYEFSPNLHQRASSNCSTSASILGWSRVGRLVADRHIYVILYEPPRVKFACVIPDLVNVEAIKKALKLKQFSVIYRKSLLLPLSNRNRGDSWCAEVKKLIFLRFLLFYILFIIVN